MNKNTPRKFNWQDVYELFDHYFGGTANDKERKIMETWKAPKERKKFFGLSERVIEEDRKKTYHHLANRYNFDKAGASFEKRFLLGNPYRQIAAALVLILVLANSSSLWLPWVQQSAMTLAQVEKVVLPGERQHYELPDGTQVWLNSGSQLTYPRFFLGQSREVALSGEAFFKVAHDARHPFIIHTGEIYTRVLGTSFNIQSYGAMEHTIVTVATGKVQVGKETQLLSVLTANQEIAINNHSGEFTVDSQIDTESRLAWRSGRLIFDNAPLTEVLTILENHYNVQFNLEKADLKDQYLTADFASGTSLRQVLDVLIQINKLNFSKNNNVLTVSHSDALE